MDSEQHTIRDLRQTNRQLKLGYLVVGVLGLAGIALAQADPAPAGSSDPNANDVRVDINKVGDVQQIIGVDHERGFAVIVDEEGKITVVHRDGTAIVPNRKVFSHQFSGDKPADGVAVDRPVDR